MRPPFLSILDRSALSLFAFAQSTPSLFARRDLRLATCLPKPFAGRRVLGDASASSSVSSAGSSPGGASGSGGTAEAGAPAGSADGEAGT